MLLEAFDSNWIAPLGPHVDAFEREVAERIGVPSAAALSSGTAALHLALVLLGVGPGDEVLVSSLTFVATGNAVKYTGAEPVFVDSDEETWTIDPKLLAEEIEERVRLGRTPKAVVVVDLYGQCADYDTIRSACAEHGIAVIEDAAEALGATYRGRPAGTLGDIGVFSFNGNKVITTSGGGMLVSHDDESVRKARFLSTQARNPGPAHEHSVIGYNYRLSNLLAAVGRAQLQRLDDLVAKRQDNNAFYREALADVPGIGFMPHAPYGTSICWFTVITVDPQEFGATADDIRVTLEENDIESRPPWKPLHTQPVFRGCSVRGGRVSEHIFEHGLCIPSGSTLTARDRDRVVDGIVSACGKAGRRQRER